MESAAAVVEGEAFFVFGDDESFRGEQGAAFAAEQTEREGILLLRGVRWVEEDEVGDAARFREARERGSDTAGFEGVATANAKRGEIGADSAQGGLGFLDEDCFACAAAEGLHADGA